MKKADETSEALEQRLRTIRDDIEAPLDALHIDLIKKTPDAPLASAPIDATSLGAAIAAASGGAHSSGPACHSDERNDQTITGPGDRSLHETVRTQCVKQSFVAVCFKSSRTALT